MSAWTIITFIILLWFSAFSAGSEIAIMSIPRHLIETLIRKGKSNAKILLWLKDRTDKFLITILVVNNLVNTLIAALATKIAIDLARVSSIEEWIAIWWATAVITILILLFGDILPKTMATRAALSVGLFAAPIYKFLINILRPIVWIVEKIIAIFDKNSSSHIRQINQEEVEALVDIAKEQGSIEADMARHIKKIIDFHDTTVQEIITPRVRMEAIRSNATVDEALLQMKNFSHTRIPVYSKAIDDIEWIVSHRELVQYREQWLWWRILDDLPLRKALKVPLTMPIDKVIEVFKKDRRQMAVVMDEYGGVSGLVTLEDIVEEIFGEFVDETDKELTPIKNDGDTYIVQWSVIIDDLLDHMNLSWQDSGLDENEYSWETVAYVITSELERFPEKNEKLVFGIEYDAKNHTDGYQHKSLHLQITKRDDNTINEITAKLKIV
jgi:putative hemolysin